MNNQRLGYQRLAETLVERGLVEPQAVQDALGIGQHGGAPFPEALPSRLTVEILPGVGLNDGGIGVLLAGDFYTVPALDRRGGSGDVTAVWKAFGDESSWVVGVPGNHDTFGEDPNSSPRLECQAYR